MSEKLKQKSAVVIVGTPDAFVLEKRPYLPGKLAYPGKLQLFGGGREYINGVPEDGSVAASRELKEELDLEVSPYELEAYWSGEYEGTGKNGEPVVRDVSVYSLGITALERASLRLNVQGEIADIPKTPEAIEARADDLTPFALHILRKLVKGE